MANPQSAPYKIALPPPSLLFQTLLGIPRLKSLCSLDPVRVVVWPFQTGLRPPRMVSRGGPHKGCVQSAQVEPDESAEGAVVVMAEVMLQCRTHQNPEVLNTSHVLISVRI